MCNVYCIMSLCRQQQFSVTFANMYKGKDAQLSSGLVMSFPIRMQTSASTLIATLGNGVTVPEAVIISNLDCRCNLCQVNEGIDGISSQQSTPSSLKRDEFPKKSIISICQATDRKTSANSAHRLLAKVQMRLKLLA